MTDIQQKVQARLDQATSEKNGVAGCVFGAVDRTGKTLALAASGETELGTGHPTKTNSVFAIYSCTKAIAGIALMQLVEKEILKLDDPDIVEKHLPEWTSAKLVDGSAQTSRITLRMLLSHTAGFGYTFFNPELKAWEKQLGDDEFGGRAECFQSPLLFQPGTDWNYGVGIDIAGELLHRITGQTLGEYCTQHIFKPLGVEDLRFGVQPHHKGRLVAMHQRAPDGTMSVGKHTKMTTHGSSFDSGGAGCVGTVEDYLKVITVLINKGVGANGARILEEATVEEMFRDQIADIPSGKPLDRMIEAATPTFTYEIQMMPGIDKGWGLTFQITKDPIPTGRSAGAGWWAGLPNLYWVADPVKGIAHMWASQSFPFNDPKTLVPWLDCEAAVYSGVAQ